MLYLKVPKITENSILEGPYWSEPVEVKSVKQQGEHIQIVGATKNSRQHIDQLLSTEEFEKVKIKNQAYRFNEPACKVFLSLEAIRYRYASLYDPLLAMNASKVDPLPHQIEAVYGYILKLPRIRFLIADDPGAGKTIMAGLIVKELKLRHIAKRILIVVPGHLKDQWRRELADRFEEKFVVVDRGILDAYYAENVWARENQIITSIDFAKQDTITPSLLAAHYDLVIVDEAHKMSAYRYGNKIDKTSRYKLGEKLSRRTEHLLFLTATPHKGDPENFRLFLDLIEPGFFATPEMVEDSINSKDNPLFIRRLKEDLKNFEGEPLFLPRHVKTIAFNLGSKSPKEKELYNELSKYVKNQYNKALAKEDKKRNIAFALIILQRRLASSTFALHESLKRRKRKLKDLLEKGISAKQEGYPEFKFDFDEVEEMSEEERWKKEQLWETLSVAENREELRKEINTIDSLIERARHIIQAESELKLRQLKKSLKDLSEKYSKKEDKKILIFTESRDTLDYLEKKIKEWGYTVNTIHGGMRLNERIKAESIFKNETEVMVATEAAGEGINLQFCHLMVNYDIPWNPNRLEQRMGRIHRYGQQKEVYIFNLVAEDTREGRVLNRLFQKLEEIKNALGNDRVYDVINEVMLGKNLSNLLIDAAANARDADEILAEIDPEVDEENIARVKENLGESLATHFIDYTRIKEMAQKAREYRLIPEYTENFFKKAFQEAGGELKLRKDGFLSVKKIPYEIKKIASEDSFIKSYGELIKQYPKVTFDKDIAFKHSDAEFVSFGHPLFEAVMRWIQKNLSLSLTNGATFIDPDGKLEGYILFYEGEIKDGTQNIAGKRLFAFLIQDSEIKSVSPSIIWDLAEEENPKAINAELDSLKKKASQAAIEKLKSYKKELANQRKKQAEIKEKYGIKSLDHLILKLDRDLIDLQERKDKGEQVDLPIRNKEKRKREYETAKKDLEELIEKEKSLTMTMPRFIGAIRVKANHKVEFGMKTDSEVEKAGMEVAMNFERKRGREPEDVSTENLGFDIRSKDNKGNIRYIEVKARANTGAVALTQNEWFKAQRFKEDYYLYSVMNALKAPELYIIRNPAKQLKPDEKVEVVRYIVSFEEIKEKRNKEVRQ